MIESEFNMPTPISPLSKAQFLKDFERGKVTATPESGISLSGDSDISQSSTPRKDTVITPTFEDEEQPTPIMEPSMNPLCAQFQRLQMQKIENQVTPQPQIYQYQAEPLSHYPDVYHNDQPVPNGMVPLQMIPAPAPTQPPMTVYHFVSYPPTAPVYPQAYTTPSEPMQPLYVQVPSNEVTPAWTPEPSYTPLVPVAPPPTPYDRAQNAAVRQMITSEQSMNMQSVWHGEFDRLVAQFPDRWTLSAADLCEGFDANDPCWMQIKDGAKVRFLCPGCSHGWTSMKGRVYYWIRFNEGSRTGEVVFKLFGQQCSKCHDGSFCHSMWYPDEVKKVVHNLYLDIGRRYYGWVRPAIQQNKFYGGFTQQRRDGRPRQQHDADLCEACALGLCREQKH